LRKEEKWLKQALHDLEMAEKNLEFGGYDVCAFLCHQAVEKFMKALIIRKHGADAPRIHHLDQLARKLGFPREVVDKLLLLESDYVASRYPDVSVGVPYEEYSREDAEDKVGLAKEMIEWLRNHL
jgi:HEPN domain-containing protein